MTIYKRNKHAVTAISSITEMILDRDNSPHAEMLGAIDHGVLSLNAASVTSAISVLSPTISKVLIDKFVKDPMKFSGGKDDVTSWIEEIEQ